MLDWTEPMTVLSKLASGELSTEERWLAIVNIALGAVVLFFLAGFAVMILRNVLRPSVAKSAAGAHELFDPELGLTMADGGEKIEEKAEERETEGSDK